MHRCNNRVSLVVALRLVLDARWWDCYVGWLERRRMRRPGVRYTARCLGRSVCSSIAWASLACDYRALNGLGCTVLEQESIVTQV